MSRRSIQLRAPTRGDVDEGALAPMAYVGLWRRMVIVEHRHDNAEERLISGKATPPRHQRVAS
jgi:hypothetical protein